MISYLFSKRVTKEIEILISLLWIPEAVSHQLTSTVSDRNSFTITISTNAFQIIFNEKAIILTANNFFLKSFKWVSMFQKCTVQLMSRKER